MAFKYLWWRHWKRSALETIYRFPRKSFSIPQQWIIINKSNKSKDQKQQDRPQRYTHYNSKSSVKSSNSNDLKRHICGKEDHVPTAGPGWTKQIQCFTCEHFVEMTPADRLQFFKKKGLCFQYLYPGANITEQNIQNVNAKGIMHASIHQMINFLQRNMSLFVLNIKILKKTKRYLSCSNISAS